MNVLLVEDEQGVADFVVRGLRAEGWMVSHAADAETALALSETGAFDVVILDMVLPGLSGADVCRSLRARRDLTPVLILSALGSTDARVAGLRLGADDYLTKPFEFDELVARVEALFRRRSGFTSETERVLRAGALSLDLETLEARAGDRVVELTAKEREMLRLLLSKPGAVFSRERILSSVWGANEDPLTNIIEVYVRRLRRKRGPHGAVLKTVRGAGYRLVASEDVDP
ncbi:MAG: response regulator transcription factor [Paracoccaceae bacterium]